MADSKKGTYFLKDKKASIYHPIMGYDRYGNTVMTGLELVAFAWCYARQLSQEQLFMAGYYQKETRMFVFNYIKGVSIGDAIKYRDEWYIVTRTDTTDDYNGELFVYVKTWEGTTPKDDMIH